MSSDTTIRGKKDLHFLDNWCTDKNDFCKHWSDLVHSSLQGPTISRKQKHAAILEPVEQLCRVRSLLACSWPGVWFQICIVYNKPSTMRICSAHESLIATSNYVTNWFNWTNWECYNNIVQLRQNIFWLSIGHIYKVKNVHVPVWLNLTIFFGDASCEL